VEQFLGDRSSSIQYVEAAPGRPQRPVVVPAAWLMAETMKVSKGGETPELAAFGAMRALDRWADATFTRCTGT
jgi:hypothetical protein